MAYEVPTVSIIVPMYNTEKYIGELLDSVLAQTFRDFELIIVNNGSTDGSQGVVDSYLPKFNNRLKLMKIEKNTGYPSIPRNMGLNLSRGKYIFFMDSDDVLTKTALEEMHNLAEKYQVDVLCCERCYKSTGIGQDFVNNRKLGGFIRPVDTPTFMSEDTLQRLQIFLQGNHNVPPWYRFSLRDFLIQNEIKFPPVFREDDIWSLQVLCMAKKFLRVPNCCYIKRDLTGDNLTTQKRTFEKYVHYWLDKTIHGLKFYYEFMEKVSFFKANPHIRDEIIRQVINSDLRASLSAGANLPPHVMFDVIRNEFKDSMGDNDVLISALCVNNYVLYNALMNTRRQLANTTPPC